MRDIGILPDDFSWDVQNYDCDRPLKLLYVGSLTAIKGIHVLVEACGMLKNNNVRFALDIIGEGGLQRGLKRAIERLGLTDQVAFKGFIARRRLGPHFLNADVVCVPSLNDPLPTVVLEALSAGIPVVGSAVGGIPAMVKNGVNGLLVPAEKPGAIADAIAGLYRHPARLARMAKNARPSVYPEYEWRSIGRRLRTHIDNIIAP
jgi:glycosyltransferase involved in cell wall biosynthesis